jgi:hypothetical protein
MPGEIFNGKDAVAAILPIAPTRCGSKSNNGCLDRMSAMDASGAATCYAICMDDIGRA